MGSRTDAKFGGMYYNRPFMLSMSITSMTCTLLYSMSMWPDRHFRDTPPHFARGPGDVAKCFSLAGSRGMGMSATVSSAAQEPGGLTS